MQYRLWSSEESSSSEACTWDELSGAGDDSRPGVPACEPFLPFLGFDEREVVYETRGLGDAFLAPPECADGVLTVTAYAETGDGRVWARVPG